MIKRALLLVAIVSALFAWGVAVGAYHVFPWQVVKPAGQAVMVALRSIGLVPEKAPKEPKPEKPEPEPEPEPEPRSTVEIGTGLLNFDLTVINETSPVPGEGGSLGLTAEGMLIVRDQGGRVSYYEKATDSIRQLGFLLPSLNIEAVPPRTPGGRAISDEMMRYQDVEVFGPAGAQRIAVNHLYFDGDRQCTVMRLEIADLPADWASPLAEGAQPQLLDWQLVFEAHPCIALTDVHAHPIPGNQAGGRIIVESDTSLLVSTGDLAADGLDPAIPLVSQEEDSLWGRVLSVDLTTNTVTEISRGHRNPQGMARDRNGRLWVAEHAPRGGDELNLITQGSNYGWPLVTLGVNYVGNSSDRKMWPSNNDTGRHEGYPLPVYAWMPSIAPSSMKLVEGLSDRWDGDLLISTLIRQALYRVRLDGDRVLYHEPIPLGRRVRDLEVTDGRIYLLFDDGTFGYMVPHEMIEAGPWPIPTLDVLTKHGCLECHSNPAAPGLARIVGRNIASQAGITYSDALKAVKGKWTEERLDAFLTDPQAFAPGTSMPTPALDAEARKEVVEELARFRPI